MSNPEFPPGVQAGPPPGSLPLGAIPFAPSPIGHTAAVGIEPESGLSVLQIQNNAGVFGFVMPVDELEHIAEAIATSIASYRAAQPARPALHLPHLRDN